jgi:hypothetical protein
MTKRHGVSRAALASVSCLLFLLLAGHAEAASSQSILYTGQAHFAFNHEPYSPGGGASEHGGYTFKWEMSASGDLASGTVHWNVIRLEGGWNYEGMKPGVGGGSYQCYGGFAYRSGAELPLVFVSESSPYLRTGSGSDATDEYLVQVRAPTEVAEQTGLEGGEMPESCWSGPGSPYLYSALGNDLNFPAEGTYTVPVESSSTYTNGEGPCMYVSDGPCEASDTITSQVTFNAGGVGSGVGPTAPPATGTHPPNKKVVNKDKRKRDAAQDLEKAVKDALAPCAVSSYGSLAAATKGGLLTGTLGGQSAADALAAAGESTYSAWSDQCEQAIKRIEADFKTAEDPPTTSWGAFAEPASLDRGKGSSACGRLGGIKAKICKLRGAQGELVGAVKRSASVAGAIEATIDRESGALDASDQADAKAQGAQAAKLQARYEGALKAQKGAEAAFAAALKKAGLKLNLTKGAKKRAGKLIAAKLSAGGVSRAKLAKFTSALPG